MHFTCQMKLMHVLHGFPPKCTNAAACMLTNISLITEEEQEKRWNWPHKMIYPAWLSEWIWLKISGEVDKGCVCLHTNFQRKRSRSLPVARANVVVAKEWELSVYRHHSVFHYSSKQRNCANMEEIRVEEHQKLRFFDSPCILKEYNLCWIIFNSHWQTRRQKPAERIIWWCLLKLP